MAQGTSEPFDSSRYCGLVSMSSPGPGLWRPLLAGFIPPHGWARLNECGDEASGTVLEEPFLLNFDEADSRRRFVASCVDQLVI